MRVIQKRSKITTLSDAQIAGMNVVVDLAVHVILPPLHYFAV